MITATVTSMDTVTEGYAQWCPSMDGQWMVTATVTPMDTVNEGYAQWCPSMDGHGLSWLL